MRQRQRPATENRLPTAQLTAGPVEGDTTNYQVRLFWTGSDPDGHVTGYQYALDPPAEFTEEEIAAGALGIEETFLPGADGAPDTTRVSKLVGAQPFSFDWIHTEEFSRLFRFSADARGIRGCGVEPLNPPAGSSACTPSTCAPSTTRARAPSRTTSPSPRRRSRPRAESTGPSRPNSYGYLVTSPTFRIQWSGTDPDRGREGHASPLRVRGSRSPQRHLPDLRLPTDLPLRPSVNGTWLPLPADSTGDPLHPRVDRRGLRRARGG